MTTHSRKSDFLSANLAVAVVAGFVLSAGLVGCKSESKEKKKPAAATQADSEGRQSPSAGAGDSDKAHVRDLEAKLQAASDEAAKSAEQIGKIAKDRDAALAKVKEAQASEIYLRSQLDEEKKAAAEAEGQLKNLRSTLAALRERLWATGQEDWVVRVEAEAFENQKDVQVKENAQASGGKALLFDKATSAVDTVIDVKPGTYRVVPVGMAPDGGDHDTLELTVKAIDKETGAIDVQQRVSFDEKWDQFVAASGSPPIVVAIEGKLRVGLRATEETGAILDRVEIRVHVPK